MEEDAMVEVADLIDRVLSNLDDPEIDTIKDDVRNDVRELTEEYPLYPFIRDEGFAATGL
jgi:glycine/serine hydroxymethyltransferase